MGQLFWVTLENVEAYDTATGRWTVRAPLPMPRAALASGVIDGVLYAVGGDLSRVIEAYLP